MLTGILAGLTWAAETIAVSIALESLPYASARQAVLSAPLIATFLHDALSALLLFMYNAVHGGLKALFAVCKLPDFKWLVVASAIGGPVGMTGYVMTVHYMGASVGAVASAVYPAIGTLLAFLFLKEKMPWYRWVFLAIALFGVYGLSYSPQMAIENFWLGLVGTFMCAFGWGVEAVILAKCLKNESIHPSYALNIRQSVSALIYGGLILPILDGWKFVAASVADGNHTFWSAIAVAALFASISYLLYYRTIAVLGASKAMALNITYTAWAVVFTVLILRDTSTLNWLTILCSVIVVVCGILSASEISILFHKKRKL